MKQIKVVLYADNMSHRKHWIKAFGLGLKNCGQSYEVVSSDGGASPNDADLHVFWSMNHPRILEHCKKTEQFFLCLERGYIDRLKFTSMNLNGLHGRSQLITQAEHCNAHCKKHGWEIKPRSSNGEDLVIMGQVLRDASLEGVDFNKWVQEVAKYYSDLGESPIFKPHPAAEQPYDVDLKMTQEDISTVLNRAKMVITYSSNSGVDAWLAGVPCRAWSPVSMLYKTQTQDGQCSDIAKWLNDISYRQYNADETEAGEAWHFIRQRIFPSVYK